MATTKLDLLSAGFWAPVITALNALTVGYQGFKQALISAIIKRTHGMRGGHLLVIGPPGVAKTHTTKGLAQILQNCEMPVPYARIQGTPDLTTADFLFRRVSDYNGEGKLRFLWQPQVIREFERRDELILPGILQVDEIDRIPGTTLAGFLQAMEEQEVSVLDGTTLRLFFVLVATANSRRYDPTAKPIPRAVQDRFGAMEILEYLSIEEDEEVLRRFIAGQELRVAVESSMLRNMVTAVKLTQGEIRGFTNFSQFVRTPSGPRGFLDLYAEAAVNALLSCRSSLTVEDIQDVCHRTLRGHMDVQPEAEAEGKTVDSLITEIIAEVFLGKAVPARPQ